MVAPFVSRHRSRGESGQSLVFATVSLVALLMVAALVVDLGQLLRVRTQLQGIADAAALAAAAKLPSRPNATVTAQAYSMLNDSSNGVLISADEVVVGNWNGAGTFTPDGEPVNSVRVVTRRTDTRNSGVVLLFGGILGSATRNVAAWATATSGYVEEDFTRFIIDAEMIDSDIPVIEDLADSLGMDKEEIISDNDGDWFIDLPPGVILELPTGQVGDEGLFDITHDAFPFGQASDPSYEDFLNYNEDSGSWRYNLIPKPMLDPLLGVTAINDAEQYAEFVKPFRQVSPVYKSDVNVLNPVQGDPAVNRSGGAEGCSPSRCWESGATPTDPAAYSRI